MEKVTRANGCLVVIPGTHKKELLRHRYPEWKVNRTIIIDDDDDDDDDANSFIIQSIIIIIMGIHQAHVSKDHHNIFLNLSCV